MIITQDDDGFTLTPETIEDFDFIHFYTKLKKEFDKLKKRVPCSIKCKMRKEGFR